MVDFISDTYPTSKKADKPATDDQAGDY